MVIVALMDTSPTGEIGEEIKHQSRSTINWVVGLAPSKLQVPLPTVRLPTLKMPEIRPLGYDNWKCNGVRLKLVLFILHFSNSFRVIICYKVPKHFCLPV